MSIPSLFNKYFWDIKVTDIDRHKHSIYITERLLEYGDFDALRWLEDTYGKEFLIKVISNSRKLSRKSANFYSFYYHLDPKSVLCLRQDFRDKHRTIWNR